MPKEFDYEDEEVMAFPDIRPIARVHLLIVPKAHIPDFMDVKNNEILNKLREVAQKMVKKKKLENKGFRLTINAGGAQVVGHLHLHLIGPLGKSAKM
jgi:histidine triad (HIT) family protein